MYANLKVTVIRDDDSHQTLFAYKVVSNDTGIHVHTELPSEDGPGDTGPVFDFDADDRLVIEADF